MGRNPLAKLFVALAVVALLSGCGSGILVGQSNTNENGEAGGATILAIPATHVDDTRATLSFTSNPECEVYQYKDGNGPWTDCTVSCDGAACTCIVLGLSNDAQHEIQFRCTAGANTSVPTAVSIDTTIQCERYADTINVEMGTVLDVGDANADGYPDILVGSRGDDVGPVTLFSGGPHVLNAAGELEPSARFFPDLGWPNGSAVQLADVTCDGFDDVIIASPFATTDYGYVFIFRGGANLRGDYLANTDHADIVLSTATFAGLQRAMFGASLAAAAGSGGCADLLVGAPQWVDVPANPDVHKGKVFLFEGGITADLNVALSDQLMQGANPNVMAGWYAWPIGDINADGLEEILYSVQDIGGNPLSVTFTYTRAPHDFGMLEHYELGLHQGAAGGLGDLNGDGFNDFFIGLATHDMFGPGHDGGIVRIYNGGPDPDISNPLYEIFSETRYRFGTGVAVGLYDQSRSSPQLLIGADATTSVYEGPDFGDGRDAVLDASGVGLRLVDINGDGYLDRVFGDPSYPGTRPASGSVVVCH